LLKKKYAKKIERVSGYVLPNGPKSFYCRFNYLLIFKGNNMSIQSKGALLASAAGLLALSLGAFAADAPKGSSGLAVASNDKVHCYNVHDCKGNSDCKTTAHMCKGQNACKGNGFKGITAKECLAKDGTIGDLKEAKAAAKKA
jgi:hypothetical protein